MSISRFNDVEIETMQREMLEWEDAGGTRIEYAGPASELRLPRDVVMRFRGVDIKRKGHR